MRYAVGPLVCACLTLLSTAGSCEDNRFPGLALNAAQLESLRGGFQTSDGLNIALGIERTMLVNGVPVTTTILSIPDLAAVDGRGGGVQVQGPALSLIQNGARNALDPSVVQVLGPGMATIVQNTLDNQVIQGRTVLTVTISGMGGSNLGTAAPGSLKLSSGTQGLSVDPGLRMR